MKIATWNIERLRYKNKLEEITGHCEQSAADILVLTEFDTQLRLNYKSCHSTLPLHDTKLYKPSERRVQIYTNYNLVAKHPTFDEQTATCVEVEAPFGSLLVYGAIIGIFGNRNASFSEDLACITKDVALLAKSKKPLLICGDYNMTFSDNYYFTARGREMIEEMLLTNGLTLLTRSLPECIDHIALSESVAKGFSVYCSEWNQSKRLSDHKGVAVELTEDMI
ncbi:endonuclease/exonuclease/phosphatase family protein [Ruminococcaceae bacterium OttesenSCG-928-L11]|nr:endonuclease/exonuclease/phosphatase family protein [Ruminococcaceae bacterium OttesenSCG-928-L11]